MRVDGRLLNWGLFFILLGAIPLAVRQGLLTPASVDRWWSLWPLLLIAAGVGLLLRRTPLEFTGGLLAAGTLGLMAGSALAGGFGSFPLVGCGGEGGAMPFPTRDGELSAGAEVRVELDCGELTLATGAGSGWRVEGVDDDGRGPRIDATAGRLVVRSSDERVPFGLLGKRDRWTVTVPRAIGIDLDVAVDAGRGMFDLGDGSFGRVAVRVNAGETSVRADGVADLTQLEVAVNAGSATIDLPSVSLRASLSVNAGSISFCASPDVGLRIRTNDNITAGNNFDDHGLSKSGTTWETPGYGDAEITLDIDAEANAGSFTLNPAGGCNG